jgi:asparagine synthase (glutamine-hydrolysing)
MSSADGRYHVLLNGEIYNYRELRAELEQFGWRFRTMSDTEVLLAGYAVWGESVLQRIVGMFSFAVLDSFFATLFVARDPFGIKPFYYACGSGWLVFASEIKPLLEFPGISRRVNARQLQDFMVNGISDRGNETLFADILQLPAAHRMHISCEFPDRAAPVPYWSLAKQAGSASSLDAPGRFRELFQQSVRLHLRSTPSATLRMTPRYVRNAGAIWSRAPRPCSSTRSTLLRNNWRRTFSN